MSTSTSILFFLCYVTSKSYCLMDITHNAEFLSVILWHALVNNRNSS